MRIAHLVHALKVDPASILVLTFTHKAADELRDRLGELLPAQAAARISAGTFHQLGARLLEEFGAAAGVPRPFAIFDEADRRALLKQCFPTLSARQARDALAAISADKNGLPATSDESLRRTAASAGRGTGSDPPALPGLPSLPGLASLRARYDGALAAAGALDLDDLVARTVQVLDGDAAVRRTLQRRYRWISVDEYQDVNAAQYRLLRLLAGGGANLCVIGDPDQAIYGFRGADHRYFLSFGDDFAGAETLRLDRNYRSTQAQGILTAAGQVIARHPGHEATHSIADHEARSPRDAGDRQHLRTGVGRARRPSHPAARVKLDVYRAPTDRAEAEYVVHQVERMIGGTSYFSLDSGRVDDDGLPEVRTFGDFAVLYRLNAQAKLLEEAFDRSGIPYQTAGAASLAEQQPVREILALLWLTEVPGSRLHWRRILLDGTGAASEDDLSRFLAQVAATDTADIAGAAAGSPPGRPARALELVRALAADRHAAVAERVQAAAKGWAALRGRGYDNAEQERLARLQRRTPAARAGMRESSLDTLPFTP